MAADEKAPDTPLIDQHKFHRLIEASFANAAKIAALKNDDLGIPTPVGVNGSVRYVLNKLNSDGRRFNIPDFLKTGYDADKRMWIVGGPNGAGKTTFTGEFIKNLGQTNLVKLNADERTSILRPQFTDMPLPEVNLMAAQQIDAEVMNCIQSDRPFLVETVLSSGKYRDAVLKAKERGFKICLIYVSLYPQELSPARVKVRVQKGGHDVDPLKAIKRYHTSHDEAVWFARQADAFVAFDNSAKNRKPILVAAKFAGEELVYNYAGVNPKLDGVISALRINPPPYQAPVIG